MDIVRTLASVLIALLFPVSLAAQRESNTKPAAPPEKTAIERLGEPDTTVGHAADSLFGQTKIDGKTPVPLPSAPENRCFKDLVAYRTTRKPSSRKALLFAVIPGGGQIYNRSYWKLPVVIGAFTACAYAVTWNSSTYNDYLTAYRDLLGSDPMSHKSWQAYIPRGADPKDYVQSGELKDRLKRGSDRFRRYRDLSIVVTVGVYALSLLDAYVDAELYDFDISPVLSMRVGPSITPGPDIRSSGYGFHCSFLF